MHFRKRKVESHLGNKTKKRINTTNEVDEGQNSLENPSLSSMSQLNKLFKVLNVISSGTYGAVYRAQKADGTFVALKHVKYNSQLFAQGIPIAILREIGLLFAFKHPNLVALEQVVIDSSSQIYLVMEYIPHELKVILDENKPEFSLGEKKALVKQLLTAVEFLHSNAIMHRDLKPSNLLYHHDGTLKLCDFGMARRILSSDDPLTGNVVTLWYRSPELLFGDSNYTTAVDMWSVGCIFAEIILRKPLFPMNTSTKLIDAIFHLCGTPDEESWPSFKSLPYANKLRIVKKSVPKLDSRDLFPPLTLLHCPPNALSDSGLDLLKRLLTLNPNRRITAKEALEHPWFTERPLPPSIMPSARDTNLTCKWETHITISSEKYADKSGLSNGGPAGRRRQQLLLLRSIR